MKNLASAIIKVMQEVKGIEKSMTIGSGNNSYKGVPDQEVKKVIGEAMAKNGLCILPIKVTPKTQIDRWEVSYNGQPQTKQSVFTEVFTDYLLLHTSGESQVISGYGHGIDSQDKGAGKATTYALKYALLYTFLVPTGKIDDADSVHSDNIPTPEPQKAKAKLTFEQATELLNGCKSLGAMQTTYLSFTKDMQEKTKELKDQLKKSFLPYLNEASPEFQEAVKDLLNGKSMADLETKHNISETVKESLIANTL